MALHGHVWVSDEVIGHYDIVRQGPVPDAPERPCRYRWTVHFPSLWRHAVTGTTRHLFDDGAAVLLAAVLAEADRRAVRIPGRPKVPG